MRTFALLSTHSLAIFVLAVFCLGSGSESFSAEIEKKGGVLKKNRKADEWLTLDEGLAKLRKTGRPALLRFSGPGATKKAHPLDEALTGKRFAKQRAKFVPIALRASDLTRVFPPKPIPKAVRAKAKLAKKPLPPIVPRKVGESLRLIADEPAYLVIDFRERVVLRFPAVPVVDKNDYKRFSLRLEEVSKRNKIYLAQDKTVRSILAQSEKLYRQGKVRSAVDQVLKFDAGKVRDGLDPELRKLVEKVIDDYRSNAEKKLSKTDKDVEDAKQNPKDSARKYSEALREYDKVGREYPFAEVLAHVRRQKALLVSYIRGLGGAP